MLNHVINVLSELNHEGPSDNSQGLCFCLIDGYTGNGHELMGWLKEKFKEWPRFSGDINYPVPHPRLLPKTAYQLSENKYSGNEYCLNRMDLLDFLLKEAQNELIV